MRKIKECKCGLGWSCPKCFYRKEWNTSRRRAEMKMPGYIPIEKAMEKIRKCTALKKNGEVYANMVSLPMCYYKRKVRVIVVKEETCQVTQRVSVRRRKE